MKRTYKHVIILSQQHSKDFQQLERLEKICNMEYKYIKRRENVIKQPCDVLLDTYLYLQLKEPETIIKQQKIYGFILQYLVQKRKQEIEQQYKVFNINSIVQSINDQLQNPELENEISYDNFLTRFSDNWGEEFERGIDINTSEHTVITNIEISSFKVADYFMNEGLRIESCQDIEFIRVPKRIKNLQFVDCDIQTLNGIGQMKQLQKLTIQSGQQLDLRFIRDLTNLTFLCVSQYRDLSDISVLQFLKKVRVLDLSHNSISDLYSVTYLKDLVSLNISGNKIIDVSYLKNMCFTFLSLKNNFAIDQSAIQPQFRDNGQQIPLKSDILMSKRMNSFYNSQQKLQLMRFKTNNIKQRFNNLIQNANYSVKKMTHEQIVFTQKLIHSQFFQ
ncbi:Conserved_hypothetical protein [Hexamita inflata]|uniref:Uncharacterized protein n=2 Tax=Hexamita inflata TaxID=28002 RepID=A0AA86R4R1_9EUKA|nr:Conserved hypothetical protein [Hexamita inflata]